LQASPAVVWPTVNVTTTAGKVLVSVECMASLTIELDNRFELADRLRKAPPHESLLKRLALEDAQALSRLY
jgi:hypothetical protein